MAKATRDDYGSVLQLLQPAPTHKTVAISAASAQSAALAETTTIVELYCDTTCFVAVGTNPTAVVTSIPVYGGIPRTIKVNGGEKVAGILPAAGNATLRIVEMV